MQQLKPVDHSQRRRYIEWVLEKQAMDGNFSNKIYFCSKNLHRNKFVREAHFKVGGYVNKKNCRN